MLKFIRVVNNTIISEKTKKKVSREDIRELIKKGFMVSYTDKKTKEDLRYTLFEKEHAKQLTPEIADALGIGPDVPLVEPKKRKCNTCSVLTINRFRCTHCIERLKSRIDDEYIYF